MKSEIRLEYLNVKFIAVIYNSAEVQVSYGQYKISQGHFDGGISSRLRYENDIPMINK